MIRKFCERRWTPVKTIRKKKRNFVEKKTIFILQLGDN
jgi:hypothetical protein